MKINTKFNVGDKVWFYSEGKLRKDKIYYFEVLGKFFGLEIFYELERKKDKKVFWEKYVYASNLYPEMPKTRFIEKELHKTKNEAKQYLINKANEYHIEKLERLLKL